MVRLCIQEDIMAAQYVHMDCPIREKMQATTASFVMLEYIVRSTLKFTLPNFWWEGRNAFTLLIDKRVTNID
jgi:hypothetical protein